MHESFNSTRKTIFLVCVRGGALCVLHVWGVVVWCALCVVCGYVCFACVVMCVVCVVCMLCVYDVGRTSTICCDTTNPRKERQVLRIIIQHCDMFW